MPKSLKISTVVFIGGLLIATSAGAHHSFTQFDRETELVTTATVVRWEFNNPHSWLRVNIENDDGTETLWSFEGSAPPSLIRRGITGTTFEPGDTITLMYCRMLDGRPAGHMGWALFDDGTLINPSDGGCNSDDASMERWMRWLDAGFTSNKEALAAGAE